MSTSKTYNDPVDNSRMTVREMKPGPRLRFSAYEHGSATDVDLDRESVKALVEQATKWLEDTEVKLPTTLGSIITVTGRSAIVNDEYHLVPKSLTRFRDNDMVLENVWVGVTTNGWEREEALVAYLRTGAATITRDAGA